MADYSNLKSLADLGISTSPGYVGTVRKILLAARSLLTRLVGSRLYSGFSNRRFDKVVA